MRCRIVIIFLVYIIQSCFSVPKGVRLNSIHYLQIKIYNKKDPGEYCRKSSIRYFYKDIKEIYKKCTKKPYLFITIDTTLPVNDLLRFRKNILYSF